MVTAKSKEATRIPPMESELARKPKPLMLGRFRLVSLLGEGSRGKVFRAEDTQLRRHVALKCVHRRSEDPTARDEVFLQQMHAAAAIDHSGVVRVLEVGVSEGFRYIAMELIEGGTLAALINGCGSLDRPRASQLCAEAAEALASAAEQGIVHGDIKPENLLLTRAGRCKIADFGLSQQDPGVRTPTPYMAPEFAGGLSPTEKSDVYSLAAVYYFLLTGKAPPAAADLPGAAGPDVRALHKDLPQEVARIIAKGMAKNPDDRPMAVELALQLRAQTIPLGDSQVLSISGPATLPEPATDAPVVGRWELVSLLMGTLAVVVVVLIAWLVLRTTDQKTLPMPDLVLPNQGPMHPVAAPAAGGEKPSDLMDLERALASAPPILASDVAAVAEAAQARRPVDIIGTVSGFRYDQEHHIALLIFAENPNFTVCYRAQLAEGMTARFGGTWGKGIVGNKVRVEGRPELIEHVATILIENPQNIELAR